jgi:hypothetical protein
MNRVGSLTYGVVFNLPTRELQRQLFLNTSLQNRTGSILGWSSFKPQTMNDNLTQPDLGISHITGKPVRSIKELHKAISNVDEFHVMIQSINHIFNSYFKENTDYNEKSIFHSAMLFRILFIELFQNITNKDLQVLSKDTGNPVRSIQEIYNELSKSTLSQNLYLLNEVTDYALHGECEEVSDIRAQNYLTLLFREVWTEIFLNIHNGIR